MGSGDPKQALLSGLGCPAPVWLYRDSIMNQCSYDYARPAMHGLFEMRGLPCNHRFACTDPYLGYRHATT